MINGAKPEVGKTVWDIHTGYGKIISVEEDMSFSVYFSKKVTVRYSVGGYVGKTRRIYWDNPIVVEPKADDRTWNMYSQISKSLYKLVCDVHHKV